jgi:hypothetical protein
MEKDLPASKRAKLTSSDLAQFFHLHEMSNDINIGIVLTPERGGKKKADRGERERREREERERERERIRRGRRE